ncbi:MAG TPA: S8 family serine peptidase [Gaiellaceae bacterium]
MNRGLVLVCAAGLALPFAAASAGGPTPARGRLVELVVTLKQTPLAMHSPGRRPVLSSRSSVSYLRALSRDQDALVTRLEQAVPDASVRWRYRVVLNGLAVVAPESARKRIAALPGVADVYASTRYHRSLFRSPAVIGAPQLWGPNLATAGDGIKIGIIDDGVDRKHRFFSPSGFAMPPGYPKGNAAYTSAKVIVARAFPPPGANWRYARLPFDPVESEHATHVAGIAAGDYGTTAPGPSGPVKVSGVAPRAYLGNYRVLTIPTADFGLDGNSPEIVAGIEQAVRDGMNVINLSLGEPEITPSRDIVVRAIDGAAAAGVVPVIAAGNDYEALGGGTIDSPGSAGGAITAAAATKSGTIAGFSSAGPTPISLQLKPDVTAPGVGILSSIPAHFGSWGYLDGTSMAAPHVAGAAALLRQRHPGWTVPQIKSALVLTGKPVHGLSRRVREVAPTREGGGMIWLPIADQPLVFASPTNLSFGLMRRGRTSTLHIALTDAGGGAGTWSVSIRRSARGPGVALAAVKAVSVPGTLRLRATVGKRAPAEDTSGFLVLSKAGQTRRIPYWLHVTAATLAKEVRRLLPGPGVYRGNTRGRPALVSSYRYPAGPGGVGLSARLPGPEQVFRFRIRRPVANAGAVILSRGRGVAVSPRLVHAGDENRLTGFAGLPIRINPYQPEFYGIEPVVGVFRPLPGAYDLVFDTSSRRVAGPFTFRFWVNDTTPPSARLLNPVAAHGGSLRLAVSDRGSGIDLALMFARVDGRFRTITYSPARHRVAIGLGGLPRGRHRLAFTVSDYQETKNSEDAHKTLPNTRLLTTMFVVR